MRTLKTLAVCFSTILSTMCLAHENHTSAKAEASIAFVQNKGQWHANALYKAGVGHGSIFLEHHAFTHVQMHAGDEEQRHHLMHDNPAQFKKFAVRGHAWKTNFIGANPLVEVLPKEKRREYHNYFLSNNTAEWAGNVPLFNEVMYNNLYHNIHLRAYSQETNFKYDFIVKAGADPSIIAMEYDGVDAMHLQNEHLLLQTSVGDFKELAPYAYQVINGVQVEVRCHYVLDGNTVRFSFPSGYDGTVDLIIDPVLVAATLSGTTGTTNYGHCATFDNDGNIYTGAISFNTGYPVNTGTFQSAFGGGGTDIAISKLSADGTTLIYATYLGGNGGDYPHSMFVSDTDELYIMGTSGSSDYPLSANAFDNTLNVGGGTGFDNDFVVTHFTDDATNIIGSTYVGGDANDANNSLSWNYGDNYRGEIIVDGAGNCYVAGSTNSNDFPVTAGAYQTTHGGGQDGVVFKMPPDLSSMTWATYLGGTGEDAGFGIRLDAGGNAYVCGGTSAGFFTGTGYQTTFQGGQADGYVMQLSANGSTVMNSSYWGTAGDDYAFFVDLDLDGDVYLYGQNGNGAPVTAGVYSNAGSMQFISKLDPALSALQYSTVIGSGSGTNDFVPIAFMVDDCEYAYFSGHSAFGNLPTSPGAIQTTGGFYLGVLEPDAIGLNYATFYGGGGDHVDGGTSRFDPSGIVYQGVCTSNGFNTTPGAWSGTYPAGYDIGVFKIDFQVSPLDASAAASPSSAGCAPFTVTFDNTSTGSDFIWDFDDGTPIDNSFEPTHTFTTPGVYDVMLIAIDSMACTVTDTTYLTITVGSALPVTAAFSHTLDCATMTVDVQNTGTTNVIYNWDMGDGNTYTTENVTHTYGAIGTYTITFVAGDTVCGNTDTVSTVITIAPAVLADIAASPDTMGCAPFTVDFTNNSNGVTYSWNFDDGSPLDNTVQPTHTFMSAGTYDVMLIAIDSSTCNIADTTYLTIVGTTPAPVVADFTATQNVNCSLFQVETDNNSTGNNLVFEWDMGDGNTYVDSNVVHQYGGLGTYTITLIVTDSVCYSSDTTTVTVSLQAGMAIDLGPDQVICDGNSTILDAGVAGLTYSWNTQATTQTIVADTAGTYAVVVSDGVCEATDTVHVQIAPGMDMGYVDELCVGQLLTLDPGVPAQSYLWNTGATTQQIQVMVGGEYIFTLVDDFGCTRVDTITVIQSESSIEVFAPNAFTPNGDGVNDIWYPVGSGMEDFELQIFTRWGELIFTSNSIDVGWDGTFKGRGTQNGVYVYKMWYTNSCTGDDIIQKFGHIVLVR